MEADTALVVVEFLKPHCHSDARKTATTRPKSAAAHWLRKFGVEPVGFLPPRSGEREGVEVQKGCLGKLLRGSGEFGVFSRPFYVRGESRVYKDVQLPEGFDLQAALRKAKAVGPTILGVVLRNKGLGLRTKESDSEKGGWTDLHSRGRKETHGGHRTQSRRNLRRFYGRAQQFWDHFDECDSQELLCVMQTSEKAKVHRSE